MSQEPFDPNAFQVSDAPEHVVPNHKVKADNESTGIFGMGKLRQPRSSGRDAKTPALPKPKKEAPPYREGMYVEPMRDFYEFLGLALMPFRPKASAYLTFPEMLRDNETGAVTEGKTGAQKIAEAWDAAAKKSPAVRRMLESFLVVSVWGTLVAVHIPLIIGLMDKGGEENMFAGMEAFLKQQAERDGQ